MSYHVETSRFKELPDKIIVREDGYMDAYKNEGEPITDYVYVPESRIAELGSGTCNPDETETLESVTAHVMECDKCGGTYEHVNGDYERCPRCGRKVER